MRALLDTHAFLWWVTDSVRLSRLAREILSNVNNSLLFSVASAWEIAIKAQLGRLKLPDEPARFVARHLSLTGIEGLPILVSHALHVYTLPAHHRDPFDRLLIAQSQLEGLPILTSDPLIARYTVEVIW